MSEFENRGGIPNMEMRQSVSFQEFESIRQRIKAGNFSSPEEASDLEGQLWTMAPKIDRKSIPMNVLGVENNARMIAIMSEPKRRVLDQKIREWNNMVANAFHKNKKGKRVLKDTIIEEKYRLEKKEYAEYTITLGQQLLEIAANTIGFSKDISAADLRKYIERANEVEQDHQRNTAESFFRLQSRVKTLIANPVGWDGSIENPLVGIYYDWQSMFSNVRLNDKERSLDYPDNYKAAELRAGAWIGSFGTVGEVPFGRLTDLQSLSYGGSSSLLDRD